MPFPKAAHEVLAATIKGATTKLRLHTQQIVTLQSQVSATSALVPGDWAVITLGAGWSNVAGAIPAQARLLTSTTVQVIGNITGGSTTDGTVIGTLAAGFFNTVHTHSFAAVPVAGAAAVNVGVTTGNLASGTGSLNNTSVNLPTTLIPTGDHTFNLSGPNFAGGSVKLGPTSGNQFDNIPASSTATVAGSGKLALDNTSLQGNQTAAVNYNHPTITLGTSGQLVITNVNPAVSQLSFHEASLPLFTA